MIKHIVCLKMKPGVTAEQEALLLEKMKGLKESVPGVVTLSTGKTFTPERGQGYTLALVVEFKDRDGLAGYLPHPAHLRVKDAIVEIADTLMVLDYEF